MSKPFICLQTDFGLHWGAVSSMHGVIAGIDPDLQVRDLCHLIPKFQSWAASFCLSYTMPCWPAETVFVSVVDPGVGTARRACVAETRGGQYIVSPDNGTLTHIKALVGIARVREIDERVNRRPGTDRMNTFHGRDLFAYTAGRLAAGLIDFSGVGPEYPVEKIVVFPLDPPDKGEGFIRGIITGADHHFGNPSTNISIADFESLALAYGDTVLVTIAHEGREVFRKPVLYHKSFGYVGVGEAVLYNGSTGYILLGLNQASMVDAYRLEAGVDWTIRFDRLEKGEIAGNRP
jgi:S-adenosylmethionine hydrolase